MLRYCPNLVVVTRLLVILHLSRLTRYLLTLAEFLFHSPRARVVGHLLLWSLHLVSFPSVFRAYPGRQESLPAYNCKELSLVREERYEVPERSGFAKLRTTPSTTPAVDSLILTCNAIVTTTLTFCWILFFKAVRFFTIIHLSHSHWRKSSWIRFRLAPTSKTKLTGCFLIAMEPAEIETL